MASPAKFLFDTDFAAPDKSRERPTQAEVTQRIATGLEAAIRRNPEWWYPFGEIYQP